MESSKFYISSPTVFQALINDILRVKMEREMLRGMINSWSLKEANFNDGCKLIVEKNWQEVYYRYYPCPLANLDLDAGYRELYFDITTFGISSIDVFSIRGK